MTDIDEVGFHWQFRMTANYTDYATATIICSQDRAIWPNVVPVRGIPMGQPILVGHHSERRHRNALEKSNRNMRKSIDEGRRADYWAGRAERTVKAQLRKQRPDVISRRIDELETQLRKHERQADHDLWLASGSVQWALHGGEDPEARWEVIYTYQMRWVEFLQARIAFQKALYEASGGVPADTMTFEKGDYVLHWGTWRKIVRVNKKSLTVESGYSWTQRMKYSDVTEYMSAADMDSRNEDEG